MGHTNSFSGFFGSNKPKVGNTFRRRLQLYFELSYDVIVCLYYFSFFVCVFFPQSIFQPSELAVSLAKECVNQGCGIHMFVLSQQDVGGAWPGHIPYLTGGALHTYGYLQVYEELHPL